MDIEDRLLEIKKMILDLEVEIAKQAKNELGVKQSKESLCKMHATSNTSDYTEVCNGMGEFCKSKDHLNKNYLTVKQFCEIYPWPTEAGMRSIILGADWGYNNFEKAFFRVNRRVLIDVDKFWEIAKSNEK